MGPQPRPSQSLEGPHASSDPGPRRETRERLDGGCPAPGASSLALSCLGLGKWFVGDQTHWDVT